MQLESMLMAYAGLAGWALSTQRLRRELKIHGNPSAALARWSAIILIALAAGMAVKEFGPQQGPVVVIGMLSVAGLLLLLLLSRSAKLATWTGAAALVVAGASSVLALNY